MYSDFVRISPNGPPFVDQPSILETRDVFSAAVPIGRNRAVVVQRREHGGRKWVRLWTWNRHRRKNVWYPTRRIYLAPIIHAGLLADAIRNAAAEQDSFKPDWLVTWERENKEGTLK